MASFVYVMLSRHFRCKADGLNSLQGPFCGQRLSLKPCRGCRKVKVAFLHLPQTPYTSQDSDTCKATFRLPLNATQCHLNEEKVVG